MSTSKPRAPRAYLAFRFGSSAAEKYVRDHHGSINFVARPFTQPSKRHARSEAAEAPTAVINYRLRERIEERKVKTGAFDAEFVDLDLSYVYAPLANPGFSRTRDAPGIPQYDGAFSSRESEGRDESRASSPAVSFVTVRQCPTPVVQTLEVAEPQAGVIEFEAGDQQEEPSGVEEENEDEELSASNKENVVPVSKDETEHKPVELTVYNPRVRSSTPQEEQDQQSSASSSIPHPQSESTDPPDRAPKSLQDAVKTINPVQYEPNQVIRQPRGPSSEYNFGRSRLHLPTSQDTEAEAKRMTRIRRSHWPFSQYAWQNTGSVVPFHCVVGNHHLSVHDTVLCLESPIFLSDDGVTPRTVKDPIRLHPETRVKDFRKLMAWIYSGHDDTTSFHILVKMWILAAELAMWKRQNEIVLRVTSLVKPTSRIDISIVEHVYANTLVGCPLRKFVVALFCQRNVVNRDTFLPRTNGVQMWRDIIAFQNILNQVRIQNLTGIDGYDLVEEFRVWDGDVEGGYADSGGVGDFLLEEETTSVSRVKARWIITDGKAVDWSRVRWPLPNQLIFDEDWTDRPEAFFVDPEQARMGAKSIRKQIGA